MSSDNLNQDQQNQLLLMMLIQQHQQIAMIGLGKLKNPGTDVIERDLSAAKYAIDTLNALDSYTTGNLPAELKDYLDHTLTNLRLNYADEAKKGNTPAPERQKKAIHRPRRNKKPVTTKHIYAGGGVVYRDNPEDDANPLILLILRNGIWDLPKGKLEKDESSEDGARREVAEEVHAGLPVLHGKLTDTYHEYSDVFHNNRPTGKTTAWYAMQIEEDTRLSPQTEEGITAVSWFPLAVAKTKIGYKNLHLVLDAFEHWYQSRKS